MSGHRTYATHLTQLLKGIYHVPAVLDTQIHGMRTDSRLIKPGELFLALSERLDQVIEHIHQAVANGATAVIADARVCASPVSEEGGAVEIFLPNLAARAGEIAARFFQQPSHDLSVIGITGTNGKTSVSHYVAEYLSHDGVLTGVVGTLGFGIPELDGKDLRVTGYTTPDVVELHRSLAVLRDRGARCAAIEVSSHGIEQARIAGVRFEGAVFTNLSREHMDYHGTMENYGATKRRLFQVPGLRFAVINGDDAYASEIRSVIRDDVQILSCGFNAGNDIRVTSAKFEAGIRAQVHTPQGDVAIHSSLLGDFNLSNLLAVIGVGLGLERSLQSFHHLDELMAVTGRMQMVHEPGCPMVVVDFAHTPDALEKVLKTLRPHCKGQLKVVFGCGGDRDKGKRPQMAALAEALADQIWVTDDNPRTEESAQIIQDICAGFADATVVALQPDRARAIAQALASSGPDDVILVAGKGHETWQEVKGQKSYFNDVEQVEIALGALGCGKGAGRKHAVGVV